MGMSYQAFYNHEIVALYDRKRGFFKQKDEEAQYSRLLVVEQTLVMLRALGNKKVSYRDFGINIGPKRQLSKEELAEKIAKANSIQWRTKPPKKKANASK